MFEYFLKVVRDNYANFSGRARRSEYWYFVLCNILISIALFLIDYFLLNFKEIGLLRSLFGLAMFVPSLAVAIRRLHDVDKTGWLILLVFVPLANIYLLILLATEGTNGPNEYGPDPKNQYDEFNEIGKAEI